MKKSSRGSRPFSSLRACEIGLPISSVSVVASASSSATTPDAKALHHGQPFGQRHRGPGGLRGARLGRLGGDAGASSALGCAMSWPVAGLWMGSVVMGSSCRLNPCAWRAPHPGSRAVSRHRRRCRASRCRGTPGATAPRPHSARPRMRMASTRPSSGHTASATNCGDRSLMPWWWMLLAVARFTPGYSSASRVPGNSSISWKCRSYFGASRCARESGRCVGDVLQQRAAVHHVQQLETAADAEHRLAGRTKACDQRHLVAVAHAVAGPIGVQRAFAIALGRDVVAALQHQAVERLGIVAQLDLACA